MPDQPEEPSPPSAIRNARLYLVGLAASLVGNSAMSLVAGIWVKSITGSSAEAGLVSVCTYAPSLAGPLGGLVADRVRRRRLIVAVNLASALALLPLLLVTGRHTVWIVFVVMAAYGTGLVFSSPAENGLFVEMLPDALRRRINGLYLGLQEVGRLVAPLAGAGLFAAAGGGAVALVDAATFVLAASVTLGLRLPPSTQPPQGGRATTGAWRTDVVAGARHIRSQPELRLAVVAAAAVIGVSGVGVAAQYSLVQALGRSPSFLGVLAAGLGAGSIVASLTSSWVVRRYGEVVLSLAGAANFAAGTLLYATGWLPAALAGSVVLGFALPWLFLAALNLSQRLTPDHLQGRVSAAVTLALFGPQAPVQAVGAWAIDHVGYRTVYLVEAAVGLAVAAWLARRGLRDGGLAR